MKTAVFAAASALLVTLDAAFAVDCTTEKAAVIEKLEKATLESAECTDFVSKEVCVDSTCLASIKAMYRSTEFPLCKVDGVSKYFEWMDYALACENDFPISDTTTSNDGIFGTVSAADADSSSSYTNDFDSVVTTTSPPTSSSSTRLSTSASGGECTVDQLFEITSLSSELALDTDCAHVESATDPAAAMCASSACMAAIKKMGSKIPDCTVSGVNAKTQFNSQIPDCAKSDVSSTSRASIGVVFSSVVAVVYMTYM